MGQKQKMHAEANAEHNSGRLYIVGNENIDFIWNFGEQPEFLRGRYQISREPEIASNRQLDRHK